MPHRIVIARPSVNVKVLQRRRGIVLPKAEAAQVSEASQPEHRNLLDVYEQRLIKVASTCSQSRSYVSTFIVVLSSSAVFSAVWSAKLIKQFHSMCRRCYYPSLILIVSSAVAAVGFATYPIMMFIVSATVGIAIRFWDRIFLETRQLLHPAHETVLQLERFMEYHAAAFQTVMERRIGEVIGRLEQKIQSSNAPADFLSLGRPSFQPIVIDTKQGTSEPRKNSTTDVDMELGYLSNSWDKLDNHMFNISKDLATVDFQPDGDPTAKKTSLNKSKSLEFKIDLKPRSQSNISQFDSEGWLLVSIPDVVL